MKYYLDEDISPKIAEILRKYQFSLIAGALKRYASEHPSGMEPYTIDFLDLQI